MKCPACPELARQTHTRRKANGVTLRYFACPSCGARVCTRARERVMWVKSVLPVAPTSGPPAAASCVAAAGAVS